MNIRITPGPPAVPADRLPGRQGYQLVKEELSRVRAAALAWRNGVGALLFGLIGFGLVKGRTDIGQLAAPYDAVVGALLLAALITGTTAALLLLRAAHGRPASVAVRRLHLDHDTGSTIGTDHAEALHAARALFWGLSLVVLCTGLLCAAVGVTWYGPAKAARVEVVTPEGTHCGSVVRLAAGRLTLKTSGGEVVLDLGKAQGLRPVPSCAPPA